ncbi:MAG: hypothetical protein HON23_01575 [Rickettsiales bacterium]|jgi:MSHA type pilus biogenesis protein MshL|nr:hypothetical protein [Rickettsiales bacterium]
MQFLLLVTSFFMLSGCNIIKNIDKKDPYDTRTNLSRDDYKTSLLTPRSNAQQENFSERKVKNNLKFEQMLLAPTKPKLADNKLITLSVTEDVPIKDVIIELARIADVETQISPNISGNVILMVKDRPFQEVIESIAELTNLKITVNNGILKVTNDVPYIVNYNLKFLNFIRNNSSSIAISTSTGADEITTGGTTNITSTTTGDLWSDIAINLSQIIGAELESTEEGADPEFDPFVTINKQAGIVTVKAYDRKHKIVKEYLEEVKLSSSAQVLIEAKIIEVILTDEFRTGVDWSGISDVTNANLTDYASGDSTSFANPFGVILSHNKNGGNNSFSATLNMLQEFGTTRTLSSPRVTAVNNQQALLSFSENEVYFSVTYDETTTSGDSAGSTTSISSEIQTTPIGIILSILPSVDLKNGEILMNVRPTITTFLSSVEDPAVSLTAATLDEDPGITSSVPQVAVREMDTVVRIKDGEAIVMGGLIEQKDQLIENGIPVLKDIPILGYFFKSTSKELEVTETVILLKATIIKPNSTMEKSDKEFSKKFTTDPRPFFF